MGLGGTQGYFEQSGAASDHPAMNKGRALLDFQASSLTAPSACPTHSRSRTVPAGTWKVCSLPVPRPRPTARTPPTRPSRPPPTPGGAFFGADAPETLLPNTFRLHFHTSQNRAAGIHELRRAAKEEVLQCNFLNGILEKFQVHMPARAGAIRVRLRKQFRFQPLGGAPRATPSHRAAMKNPITPNSAMKR